MAGHHCAGPERAQTPQISPARLGVADACRWALECFSPGSPTGCAMPAPLLGVLRRVKLHCEEELVLARGSHFYEVLFSGAGT